jgi:hypothetical protein
MLGDPVAGACRPLRGLDRSKNSGVRGLTPTANTNLAASGSDFGKFHIISGCTSSPQSHTGRKYTPEGALHPSESATLPVRECDDSDSTNHLGDGLGLPFGGFRRSSGDGHRRFLDGEFFGGLPFG